MKKLVYATLALALIFGAVNLKQPVRDGGDAPPPLCQPSQPNCKP